MEIIVNRHAIVHEQIGNEQNFPTRRLIGLWAVVFRMKLHFRTSNYRWCIGQDRYARSDRGTLPCPAFPVKGTAGDFAVLPHGSILPDLDKCSDLALSQLMIIGPIR